MRTALRLLLASSLLALAGACGGDDEPTIDAAGSSTTSSEPATSVPPSTTAAQSDAVYATTPVTANAPGERAILTSVRVSGHAAEGYDRVVFEFREGRPGYTVAYAEGEVVQDGSGEVVEVEGDHTLEVRLEDTADYDEDGNSVFTGPRRIEDGTTSVVLEAKHLSSFEGVVAWAIGTTSDAPFSAHLLTSPTRLVVDIKR